MSSRILHDAETLLLLREYASLKNLIDDHKLRNPQKMATSARTQPASTRTALPATAVRSVTYPRPALTPKTDQPQTYSTKFQQSHFRRGNSSHSRFTLDRTKKLSQAVVKPCPAPAKLFLASSKPSASIVMGRHQPAPLSRTRWTSTTIRPPSTSTGSSAFKAVAPLAVTKIRLPSTTVPPTSKGASRYSTSTRSPLEMAASRKVVLGKLKTKVINIHKFPATKNPPPVPVAKNPALLLLGKNPTPAIVTATSTSPAPSPCAVRSRFKFRKIGSTSKSGSSTTTSTLTSRRRIESKYKIVTASSPRQKKGALKVARKRRNDSKYSWSSGGNGGLETGRKLSGSPGRSAAGKEPRRRVLLRSKYKLKMTSLPASDGALPIAVERRTPQRRTRQVKQFSLKYVAPSVATGVRSRLGNLVTIGSIVYKSSQTKLTKSGTPRRTPNGRGGNAISAKEKTTSQNRLITVRGIKFVMDSNRKVLQRVTPSSEAAAQSEISSASSSKVRFTNLTRIDIGGETYLQKTPGVLVKTASNQTRTLANRFKNRSLTFLKSSKQKSKQFCLFFNKFGKCNKRDAGSCPYIHDAEKIAICKRFLRDGKCEVTACPFTHELCPAKMPVCTFFLLGRCTHDACSYRHVNVNPAADICVDFTRGHCPLAERCKKWHVDACPQFSARGSCDRGDKCPLPHRRKSSVRPPGVRQAVKRPASQPVEDESSSSEEGSTKRRRLPSFISIAKTPADLTAGISQASSNVGGGLRIRPDFLKRS